MSHQYKTKNCEQQGCSIVSQYTQQVQMSLTAEEYKRLLIAISKTGTDRDFRRLYDESYERLFRTAYYFTHSDDLAREVVLDVLADVWDKRKSMIIPDDWERWSFIVTKNRSLNTLERESRRQGVGEPQEGDMALNVSPSDEVEADEAYRIYERTVWSLPERCRMTWQMVREEGLSHAEVAQRMGISEKTVDAQISKALKALREALLQLLLIIWL